MSREYNIDEIIAKKPFGWTFTDPNTTFTFSFEKFDFFYWHELVSSTLQLAGFAGVTYILAIFGIQWWMRDRPAFQLKWPLFCWNFGLGIFSILGFVRTLPGFLQVLFGVENGFYHSICTKSHANVHTVSWSILFATSKCVELGDTLFIVLRKRPLIFLQWYHHLVTMIVTLIIAPFVEPIVRWYTVLNFGVHSLMYPYFAARAIGIKIPARIANLITTLQFAQMIIGFTVNMLSMYLQKSGYDCVRYPISIQLFGFVYGSFILLFGKLFFDSVIKKGRKTRENVERKID